jgi:soluble lytic murein transglycosylase-like protein
LRYRRFATPALPALFFVLLSAGLPACAEPLFETYARALRAYNPALSAALSESLAASVIREADGRRIDARLVVALVATESAWRPAARSPAGAAGLGQLMPSTAAGLAIDPSDPQANVRGTVAYLVALLERYRRFGAQGMYERALGAYNAGPGAVDRFGGVPPYAETRQYVRTVLTRWRRLCGQ